MKFNFIKAIEFLHLHWMREYDLEVKDDETVEEKRLYTPAEIEYAISTLELIRVVIRRKRNERIYEKNYDFERKFSNNSSIRDWIETRLRPIIGDDEVEAIDGYGAIIPLHTKMQKLRESYRR